MPIDISAEIEGRADEYLTHYPSDQKRSAALPLLHLIQQEFRFIPEEAIDWVAEKLGIAPVDVLGVVTFYPGFRQVAPGRYHIRVCRTLSCAMAGSYDLMEAFCKTAGIDRSHADHHHPIAVSADGRFSLEFAECLASCGTGPVCMVEDDFYEKVDPSPSGARAVLGRYATQ
ncbi:MAG: NAD(P)H-dependent oxidoreductase subunit E [Verrucomicrobiales bacterium]